MDAQYTFYDKEALLFRLHDDLQETGKPVVFVVGAPLTATHGGINGVADVSGVISLIKERFAGKSNQLEYLNKQISRSENQYQAAFDFIAGRSGQDAANKIVRRAVSQAMVDAPGVDWSKHVSGLSTEQLPALDDNIAGWNLPPAVHALGQLAAKHPEQFGKIILTSNFDPLIEVSIKSHGGSPWRTSLSSDGSLFQSKAHGCHVVHIHGYWYGGDTLHTSQQLLSNRPTLANDLLKLLEGSVVVVLAYGGWPDIFTKAIAGLVSNENLMPEVLWAFYDQEPSPSDYLQNMLGPGLIRNRVTLYSGIDAHTFLPELALLWDGLESNSAIRQSDEASSENHAGKNNTSRRARLFRLSPLECDRPPNIDVWVGREDELRSLETSAAKVVLICGIGGEGKSALASHFIGRLEDGESPYRYWDWRDCKEQSDRIRTQIIEIIVRFSEGKVSHDDLLMSDDQELVEVFVDQTSDARAVLVLDNVDSYVDLEHGIFTGLLDRLVQGMGSADTTSRLLLTCRPDVQYSSASIVTFSIKGLSNEEAIALFSQRNPNTNIPEEDIKEVRESTNGHAFWLDLLAVQISKVPGTTLKKLVGDMRRGKDNVPDVLSSIWDKLAIREQTLLRLMAEAIRPETEKQIERFAASELGYAKFNRAFRALRALNLIVVKPVANAPDLFDLHPLVRQFVRNHFHASQRAGFIRVVITQYQAIIGNIGAMLGIHMPFAMLERWSQKVELEASAGLIDDAFNTLENAEDALIGGGHTQEYVRVARLIFESIEWETAASKYKLFDKTVGTTVIALDQLGEFDSADAMLDNYEATIPQKTARYINFCEIKAFSYWNRKKFEQAVEWASKGVQLKQETNVDTSFDSLHTLALAQRDVGDPAAALPLFLKDVELSDLTDSDKPIISNGPLYGNVGRCLQMLGELDEALICFKKSFTLLEHDTTLHSKSNRAYARKWIAEVLTSQGYMDIAEAFLVDAIRILGPSAPGRVRELYVYLDGIRGSSAEILGEAKATRMVTNWMKA
ncbi:MULTISPECIES: NB-ARC domain-containing protein [Sphingobium]|uniref:NB-ARC domain-containing protein n=1 Tax=Sphingobium TaxID=165695 RepID=UPI0011AE4745|nr:MULTISPECIES: NB-ARC domain-containing protein [Sphingobium]KAA9015253.1 hypothetical protein F4U94_13340 [Sphingobium limneticum]